MRGALLFSALFFSLTTLASTTLEFVSGDYKVVATLDMNTGCVQATTQTHGICMGTFVLDLANEKNLTITFANNTNGCEMENAVVNIDLMEFNALMSGTTMNLNFISNMFPDMRIAQVRVVPMDMQ